MLLVWRPRFENHWLSNLASAWIILVKLLLDITKDLQLPNPVSSSVLILLDQLAAFWYNWCLVNWSSSFWSHLLSTHSLHWRPQDCLKYKYNPTTLYLKPTSGFPIPLGRAWIPQAGEKKQTGILVTFPLSCCCSILHSLCSWHINLPASSQICCEFTCSSSLHMHFSFLACPYSLPSSTPSSPWPVGF